VSDAGRSEAGEEGGDVTGVGYSEGAGGAVVIEGEAEEFGGEGVGFAVIQGREARDEIGEVRGVLVFDAEVVNYQDKGDGARGVTEKTGGKGLVKVEGETELDETIELNKILTQGREATRVEGGTEGSRRSPPAVPRTRRSTSVS
jgi:hypothetical protein